MKQLGTNIWKKLRILNFRDFLCPNLLRWMVLIKQMHRLPRKMLQQNPISFRQTKMRVLNIWRTLPYSLLKSTNKNHNFFSTFKLQITFRFLFLNIYRKYKPLTAKTLLRAFQGLKKLQKTMWKKLKAPYHV